MTEKRVSKLSFQKWEKDNRKELKRFYRLYLEDTILADENFDIITVENYWEWCQTEYEIKLALKKIDE